MGVHTTIYVPWLISKMSRACCQCHYESDRPIYCLVDQDDVFSPNQADDQVIGRRQRAEPGRLEPPFRAWQCGRILQRGGWQFACRLTRDRFKVFMCFLPGHANILEILFNCVNPVPSRSSLPSICSVRLPMHDLSKPLQSSFLTTYTV